jgi:hypothetical protein
MKKNLVYYLSLFTALAFSVQIFSCRKIDQSQSLAQQMTGKWVLTEFGTDDNGNGKIDPWELTAVASGFVDQVTFNANNTGVETTSDNNQSSLTLQFTWSLSAKDTLYRVGTGHEDITYFLFSVTTSNLTLLENTTSGLVEFYYAKK